MGIDISHFDLEYPLQALLRKSNPSVQFAHMGVNNASSRYQPPHPFQPCAVVCLNCAADREKMDLYRSVGEPVVIDQFVVCLRKNGK